MSNVCTTPNASLGLDVSCLSIMNANPLAIDVHITPAQCEDCDPILATVPPNSTTAFPISSTWPLHLFFTAKDRPAWCHHSYDFIEHGHYGLNTTTPNSCSEIYTIQEPPNPYLPLLAATMVLTICALLNVTTKFLLRIIRGFLSRGNENPADDTGPLEESENMENEPVIRVTRASTRIKTIDAFRGLAVLLMIFVNNGGGGYYFFIHAPWFGLTVADLVLPWFAWIMGVTIVLSLRGEMRLSISRPRIIIKFLRRAAILVLLGLVINGQRGTRLEELRFPGVLQLLGITYFVCASIETIGMKSQRNYQYGRFAFLQDILDAWVQWLIVLGLMATHLLITFLLPVPGCPEGYLGPGGNERQRKFANCTAGAAGYIDRLILGDHIYRNARSPVYGAMAPHDPEGILNTLSAVLIVQLGVQAGRILFCYYLHNASKIVRWFSWATFIGLIAGFLCNWSNENSAIPVSKNMMSLSFVLTTSCFAFILFAVLYYVIDHRRIWDGGPFVYAGTNAIFLYLGHYFTMKNFPWAWKLEHPSHASLLAMNIWTTALWGFIGYLLYRKDIIITL